MSTLGAYHLYKLQFFLHFINIYRFADVAFQCYGRKPDSERGTGRYFLCSRVAGISFAVKREGNFKPCSAIISLRIKLDLTLEPEVGVSTARAKR